MKHYKKLKNALVNDLIQYHFEIHFVYQNCIKVLVPSISTSKRNRIYLLREQTEVRLSVYLLRLASLLFPCLLSVISLCCYDARDRTNLPNNSRAHLL